MNLKRYARPTTCASARTPAAKREEAIRVALLGTGTPFPSAERFGTSILVEAGGKKLLFDCGRGAVIRLAQEAMRPNEIDAVFLTHLHSDHVVGLPDMWLTGWFLGRQEALKIFGPCGTRSMAAQLTRAFAGDIAAREEPPENLPRVGAEIDAKDIGQGIAYENAGVRVTAFLVDHLNVKPAFGYRVEHGSHVLVISGDTRFSENLVRHARGADCVMHAAWCVGAAARTPLSQRSIATAEDAGRVFAAVKPRLALVYHYKDMAGIARAVRTKYSGPLLIGMDLTVIEVGEKVTWHMPT